MEIIIQAKGVEETGDLDMVVVVGVEVMVVVVDVVVVGKVVLALLNVSDVVETIMLGTVINPKSIMESDMDSLLESLITGKIVRKVFMAFLVQFSENLKVLRQPRFGLIKPPIVVTTSTTTTMMNGIEK